MGKKKDATQLRPAKSFTSYVEDASLQKVVPYIKEEMNRVQEHLYSEMQSTLRIMYLRMITLESLACNKFGLSKDEYADLVADTEDLSGGFISVGSESTVETGDRVRITLASKTKAEEDYRPSTRLILDNVNTPPYGIGPELEPQVVGMCVGETKEFTLGENKDVMVKVTIDRIARKEIGEKT
jgi:hypothetical protein